MFDDDYTPYPDGYDPPDTDDEGEAAQTWTDADKLAASEPIPGGAS